ncbi:acyl-CoA thioesterase [Aestuariibaculum marinum]|uniref:Acyl-CoA thioesterase 2 n=1 Tax=Aestuariibaculum marinum TaxID=2683592 RepID=A0A8J6Q3U4_9FLAO|nr:acyl-CoA thioesterase II [Aestuariibaculum marinum]MBD0823809.1 acyl-CoA thioesterase II [Aestuariibaculum marinum]
MTTVNQLIDLIKLGKTGDTTFVGNSVTIGSPHVFGGQVLAQAINAASRTDVKDRILHSMHAYFLEAGDLTKPIEYNVSIVRDGGSFSVRRVTAAQEGTTIFILSASFHKEEEGYNHQIEMPKGIKQPEELLSWTDMLNQFGDAIPSRTKSFIEVERPIEFKPVEVVNPFNKEDLPSFTHVWFKLNGDASSLDHATKQQILTYISDYNILAAAMNRHASKAHYGNTQTASLDHSMWYFRDFDFNDWMLYSIESPNTSNARGFARGNIFTRDGKLVASVTQEGLMRPIKKK